MLMQGCIYVYLLVHTNISESCPVKMPGSRDTLVALSIPEPSLCCPQGKGHEGQEGLKNVFLIEENYSFMTTTCHM